MESIENFEEKVLKPENFEHPGEDLKKQELENKMLKISDLRKTFATGF